MFSPRKAGFRELEAELGPKITELAGRQVRDKARQNARSITSDVEVIEMEQGRDSEGFYVDVGYLKNHPNFTLWFHEVGTSKFPARPHLRPAIKE